MSEPDVVVRDKGTKDPVSDDHPLYILLNDPHPDYSRAALFETLLIHLESAGESYVHKGRNAGGEVIRLTPLRPDRVLPVPGPDGRIAAYTYAVDGMEEQRLPARDVMRMILPDPADDYHGLSPIVTCAKFGDIDAEAAHYLRDFFVNGAIPGGILKLKVEARSDERERIKQQWRDEFGRGTNKDGATGWHKLAVMSTGDAEYEALATSLAKLGLDSVWGITESRICAAFKVPPVIIQVKIGLTNTSSYASYESARKSFWRECLAPTYGRLDAMLTRGLAPEYDEKLEVVFDLSGVAELTEGEDTKIDRAVKLYSGGLRRLNECREMLGYEPLAEDYLVVPSDAVKVDKKGKAIEAPKAEAPVLSPGSPPRALPSVPGQRALPAAEDEDADEQGTGRLAAHERLEAHLSRGKGPSRKRRAMTKKALRAAAEVARREASLDAILRAVERGDEDAAIEAANVGAWAAAHGDALRDAAAAVADESADDAYSDRT